MCQFMSGILKKDGKTIWSKNIDDHSTLISNNNLQDSDDTKRWIRYEVSAIDNDIFNHDKKNWKIKIDETNIPEWYERQKAHFDKKIFDSFKECCKELFIINKTKQFEQLKDGRYFVKNSTVKAWGNSTVKAWGNSTVEAWDNSTVEALDNSTVKALGNSTVKALGNSTVEALGNSTVKALGNSTVKALGNSTVNIPSYSSNEKKNIHISEDAVLIDRKERIIYVGKKKVRF